MPDQAFTHPRSRMEILGALALSRARHVFSALTWDNPLAWPRFHGRHPLADLEGTEYLLFAPHRDGDLATPEERAAGTPLEIRGRVYDRATGRPVGDAELDVWQASPRTKRYSRGDYALRGRLRAGPDGRYVIRTVLPPPCEMRKLAALDRALFGLPRRALAHMGPSSEGSNGGEPLSLERPPHVHVIVRALGYRPLTTQLYLTNAEDRVPADAANAVRRFRDVLELDPRVEPGGDVLLATFDFAIDRRAGALRPEGDGRRRRGGRRASSGEPTVTRVPTPPPDEHAITARPHGGLGASPMHEEGLSLGSDELARQTLVDATHQGNFESLTFEQGLAAEDPSRTDELADGAPLEGDVSAWEAGVLRSSEAEDAAEEELEERGLDELSDQEDSLFDEEDEEPEA